MEEHEHDGQGDDRTTQQDERTPEPGGSATQDAKATPRGSEPVSESLSGPAYPLQPLDGERPMPLTAMPERALTPDDWDVDSTAPVRGRAEDEVLARRHGQEDEYRRATSEEGDDRRSQAHDADVAHESGYSTELEQGAAQPEPER